MENKQINVLLEYKKLIRPIDDNWGGNRSWEFRKSGSFVFRSLSDIR